MVSFPLRVSTQSPGFSNPSDPAGISRDQLLKDEIHRKKATAPTSKACKFSMNSSPSAARRASFAASVFLLRRQRRVRVSRAAIMKQPSVARIGFSYEKRKKRKMGRTQREVDVQTVQVPRCPFGLKDLRSNGVTARPPNDYGR